MASMYLALPLKVAHQLLMHLYLGESKKRSFHDQEVQHRKSFLHLDMISFCLLIE